LIRLNRNGSLTRRAYALNINDPPSNESNPPLRDRDTVIIGRSNLAKFSDTLDAVGQPLSSLANVLSLMQILKNTGN
jgi:polysaccharide export outer membrane protein